MELVFKVIFSSRGITCTVMLAEAPLSRVTVTVAVPTPTALTVPAASTVTTLGSEEPNLAAVYTG